MFVGVSHVRQPSRTHVLGLHVSMLFDLDKPNSGVVSKLSREDCFYSRQCSWNL